MVSLIDYSGLSVCICNLLYLIIVSNFKKYIYIYLNRERELPRSEFAVNMEPDMVLPCERSSRRWKLPNMLNITAHSAERTRK